MTDLLVLIRGNAVFVLRVNFFGQFTDRMALHQFYPDQFHYIWILFLGREEYSGGLDRRVRVRVLWHGTAGKYSGKSLELYIPPARDRFEPAFL
jgi:hypothetical protein